ncbi:MAG: hypothetical protein GY789_28245 [Hyphomicrobiales bacterium]|nr:hypothetical protein [Hyphomicrobiales bacterium]MCP5000159.1 hypothetical protein [Hyphomicrobiales bacterium]
MKTRLLQFIACSAIALSFAFSVPQIAQAQVLKDLGKAIENTGKGIKATGEAIEKGVEKTGDAIEKGVKKTGETISGENAGNNATDGEVADNEAVSGDVPTPQQKPVQKSYLFVQQAGSL